MKLFSSLALVAVSLCCSGAWAAQPATLRARTAGELAEICGVNPKEPEGIAKINFCHGYAQGAIDQAGEKKPFCFPNPSPTRTATMNEFVSWVRSMPDRRSMPSTEGLFKFLSERFPCK